jgi:hypothetical protein
MQKLRPALKAQANLVTVFVDLVHRHLSSADAARWTADRIAAVVAS